MIRSILTSSLFVSLLVPFASARANDIVCDGPNVRTVNQPGKPPLKYFFFPGKMASSTVIYIEGGPQPFSGARRTEEIARANAKVSPNVNLISFDFRGEGCNRVQISNFTKHPENFSSSAYADDVAAIVKDAGLRSQEFIVTGASFGTIVGAKYASRVRADDPQPLLVTLWSVVAGPMPANCDQDCATAQMYEAHLNKLPAAQRDFFKPTLEKFKAQSFPPYLGYSGDAWFSMMDSLVRFNGYAFSRVMDLVYRLTALNDEIVKSDRTYQALIAQLDLAREQIATDMQNENKGAPAPAPIANAELDGNGLDSWVLDAEWNLHRPLAPPYNSVSNPEKTFLAKNFSSRVPILYVQGTFDPITVYSDAYKSFLYNKAPEKYFAEVVDDSHALSNFRCGPDFFDTLLQSQSMTQALPKLSACTVLHNAVK